MLARRKAGPVFTTAELAERSGLSAYEVAAISQEMDWSNVPFGKMEKFLLGAGLDFTDRKAMKRVDAYLRWMRSPRFTYLHKSPEFDLVFKPLVLKIQRQYQQ